MEKSVTEGIFPGMAGLFSPVGTEQVQRLQAAGQPVDPLQAVSGSMGFLGERMRQDIGSAFGQMPQQDRKRQVFQQLVRTMQQQGVDISTPQGMVQLAQQMSSIPGLEGEALNLRQRAAQMAQQAQMQGLEAEKIRAQTAKATAEAEKAGRDTSKRYRPLTKAEIAQVGLDPSKAYQIELGSNDISQIGTGPSVVFKSPLIGAENTYAQEVGKDNAARDIGQFNAAESAVDNIQKLAEIENLLQTGDPTTGIFAEVQNNINRAKAKFSKDKAAGKKVTDTEYLDALLGSDVFPMISSLGIGARGLDTPAERDFLLKVMTGTINLDKATLVRLTEIRRAIAERAIDKYNKRVDEGEYDTFFKYRKTAPKKFEKPTTRLGDRGDSSPATPKVKTFIRDAQGNIVPQ